jgi:hypothetical protein
MNDQIWFFIIGQLATAAGIYAAIRADLREAMVRINMLEERADREHNKCKA